MAFKAQSTSNGVKSAGINSISASVDPSLKVPTTSKTQKIRNALNWIKVFQFQLKNRPNSKVKPKSSEVGIFFEPKRFYLKLENIQLTLFK
jgi:hypothetical protein